MALYQTAQGVRLEGYTAGPLHGDLTLMLASVLQSMPPSETGNPEVATPISRTAGFVRSLDGQTGDGYRWAGLHEFAVHGGRVVVAIPRASGWTRSQGYTLDRSPCTYVGGSASIKDAEAIVARVIRALRPGPATPNPTGR